MVGINIVYFATLLWGLSEKTCLMLVPASPGFQSRVMGSPATSPKSLEARRSFPLACPAPVLAGPRTGTLQLCRLCPPSAVHPGCLHPPGNACCLPARAGPALAPLPGGLPAPLPCQSPQAMGWGVTTRKWDFLFVPSEFIFCPECP